MIKQASRELLWDRIMIMNTYRLRTAHRSLLSSHLYDTQSMRYVLLYSECLHLVKDNHRLIASLLLY